MAQCIKNPTAVTQVTGEVQLLQQVKGSGVAATATQVTAAAQIQSLVWELPHTVGGRKKKGGWERGGI